MAQQTAIDWLIEQINGYAYPMPYNQNIRVDIPKEVIKQAKEMEKEQREVDYNKAKEEFMSELDKQILDFEHDYNRDLSQHKHFGGALFALNRLKFYLSQQPTDFETNKNQ